ncbi:hypothetical protein ACIA3K_11465 [Micromonospora sp. NPDC051543]
MLIRTALQFQAEQQGGREHLAAESLRLRAALTRRDLASGSPS